MNNKKHMEDILHYFEKYHYENMILDDNEAKFIHDYIINLQSKIDKANEILDKLCIYGYGQVNCRPIKNTTKQEVYNAIYEIKNVLKEDK